MARLIYNPPFKNAKELQKFVTVNPDVNFTQ